MHDSLLRNMLIENSGKYVEIYFKNMPDTCYECGIIREVKDTTLVLDYRDGSGVSYVNIEEMRVARFFDRYPSSPCEKEQLHHTREMLKQILPERFKRTGVILLECVLKFFLKKEATPIGNIYHPKGTEFNVICQIIDKIAQTLSDGKFATYRELLNNNIKKIYLIDLGNSQYYPSAKAIIIKESIAKDYLCFFSRLVLLSLYISNSGGKYSNDETHRIVAKGLFDFLKIIPEDTSELEAYYRGAYHDILGRADF